MNRKTHCFACLALALALVGCGDSPHTILRDAVTTWNETVDVLAQLQFDSNDPDKVEGDAGKLLKGPLEVLKKKWENVKKRTEKFTKLEKEEKPGYYAAVTDLKDEAKYAIARVTADVGGKVWLGEDRFQQVKGRLTTIRDQVRAKGKPTPNLDSCISLCDGFEMKLQTPKEDQKKLMEEGMMGGSQGPIVKLKNPSAFTPVTRYNMWWASFAEKSKSAPGGGGNPGMAMPMPMPKGKP